MRKEVENGPITRFIYDVRRLLAETDDSDATTKSFTSRTTEGDYGGLVSEYDTNGLEESYPVYDAQWSTRELLDDNCDVKASYRTRAFGLPTPASSPDWCQMSVDQWDHLSESGWNNLPACDTAGTFGFGGSAGY